MEDHGFTYNVDFNLFTHDATGFPLSGDFILVTDNDEVIITIYNGTGVEVDDDFIEALRSLVEELQ